jgi:hypothetical protein
MTTEKQNMKKYQVVIERVGKLCIPKNYDERWGYDAILPKAGEEHDGKPKDVRFITARALVIDEHLLLQEAHLNQFGDYHYAGCLSENNPFGIICIPPEDPLRALIPAETKMHNKLEQVIFSTLNRWYNL